MYISFELILLSILFFVLGMYMYMVDEFIYMEWDLISGSGLSFSYQFYFDFYSLMFMSIIMVVSGMICLYSYWYVDLYGLRFYYMMIGFILSMVILVVSPNLMGMLLGWDGLGFISFCLVLFYYGSESSLDNSLVTLYYNRLGDSFLLVSISWMIISVGSCTGLMWDFGELIILFMLLGLSTKSAQFPFMSWLPKAMAAPTPVSSLVHSSTLVTAGVYIMVRFFESVENFYLCLNISLLTMFISGVMALMEMDLKKVIAYSTLSQLGLMVFGLCVGMKEFVYFHMLSHAVFKSMMFMSGGVMIHELGGWQDIRYYGGCFSVLPMSGVCLLTGSFSLSGMYFLSGFYSKDILIEKFMINSLNLFVYVLFYFCMVLTLLYSFRLLDYLYLGPMMVAYSGAEDSKMSLCMLFLCLGSIFYGWGMSMLIFDFILYGYGFIYMKMLLLSLNLMAIIYYLDIFGSFYFYLNMDLHKLIKNFGLDPLLGGLDKYWVEGYGGYNVMMNFYKFIYNFKDYSVYFMFMLIFVIYFFI